VPARPPARIPAEPPALLPTGDRRLVRAEETLAAYLASARYPPSCRPIAERPDLAEPHRVPVRRLPLSGAARAKVTLRQDRYHAAGAEAVALGIACEIDGAPSSCEVLSASAAPPPDMPPAGPAAVRFDDAGRGAVAARFAPGEQGFAGYQGPLRVTALLRTGGEQGSASFDLEYTPSPPATFTGAFREALSNGSLDLYVGLSVGRPGRYQVRARIEDADGKRFAYLSDGAVLGAGAQELRLQLFGKVAVDADARPPFRLRDVEGFRFEEDAFPDREALPSLDGVVYTTGRYAEGRLSGDEWESEPKTRRLQMLAREVEAARRRDPG
jgi:hypothetical protein